MSAEPGCFYVVATPIGNLADISLRALDTLRTVDCIAAEDTRHSQRLLRHYDITTPLLSLHQHNETQRLQQLVSRLQQGQSIALISDAGTPLISDPGNLVVADMHAKHIRVLPIPGPSALVSALSVAGFAANRFIFEGFLPPKAGARQQRLKALSDNPRTLVFFEAPHRLLACLDAMVEGFGASRMAVLAREISKRFETIRRLPLGELSTFVAANAEQEKGECVIVIAGHEQKAETTLDAEALHVLETLLSELPLKQAVQLTVKLTGASKNLVYEAALACK